MDIRNWPMDRIMQLPDHCFGQRWLTCVQATSAAIGPLFDISEFGFPEWTVIWNMSVWYVQPGDVYVGVALSLGDALPATDAEFIALDILFKDLGIVVAGIKALNMMAAGGQYSFPLRKLVHTMGRRLVGRFYMGATGLQYAHAVLTVSSIPKEVPDCLLSV